MFDREGEENTQIHRVCPITPVYPLVRRCGTRETERTKLCLAQFCKLPRKILRY